MSEVKIQLAPAESFVLGLWWTFFFLVFACFFFFTSCAYNFEMHMT